MPTSSPSVMVCVTPGKTPRATRRGTLDALGLSEVPVVVGSDGGDAQKQQTAPAPAGHDRIPGDR